MTIRVRGRLAVLGLAALVCAPLAARADGVTLAEEVKPGDTFRYEIRLAVDGKMKVERDGKADALPIKAAAEHAFAERVETPDATGGVGMAVRHYSQATTAADSAGEKSERTLAADRRLIVAKRSATGALNYSPAGPLTREELELVAEHFDTLCLPGLLPGKELNTDDTWPIRPEAAQHACLFEGLIKNELVGKLVSVADGVATFTITGTAEGIEYGAHAKLTVSATGTFDTAANRITALTWQQQDTRSQGPASPATEIQATVTLTRTPLAEEPAELSAEARKVVPASDVTVPAAMTQLRYADPDGRYEFTYDRDWHVVGRTRDHLVLRVLDNGEFTAQATITAWQKAAAGGHTTPDEFKQVLGKLPNWKPAQVLADGVVPTTDGRWLYRITAQGNQDGLDVVQSFYLLAGPTGEQVAVTVVARQEKATALGNRDLELISAIQLGAGR